MKYLAVLWSGLCAWWALQPFLDPESARMIQESQGYAAGVGVSLFTIALIWLGGLAAMALLKRLCA